MMAALQRLARDGFVLFLVLKTLTIQKVKPVSAEVYSPYQYDMSAPTFTPDGRLLQLEYACRTADHSPPIFILPLSSQSNDNHNPINNDENHQMLAIVTYRPSFRLQERLLVYSNSVYNNVDDGRKSVMIGFAGVMADCCALGRKLQEDSIENQRLFGVPFTRAREWAVAASRRCHRHACGGGIRPYGANCVVVESNDGGRVIKSKEKSTVINGARSGSDTPTEKRSSIFATICTTDPSGAIQTLSGSEIERPLALVGGGLLRENKMKRTLEGDWPVILKRYSTPADQLACAFSIIQTAMKENGWFQHSANGDDNNDQSDLVYEVVLISNERGLFKLTPAQIDAIRLRQLTLN
ncbi:hypothetical protein ACA910_022263 [Epithemia clementina (nom. ined.)]